MSIKVAKPEHEVAFQDLCALMNKHVAKVDALELLAIASNMLGKLLALQDQRTVTVDVAREVMIRNIEHGNQQVIEQLMNSKGRG